MRLLIVSHVIHYQNSTGIYAYGPYVREIDIWADLFDEILIAAPCRKGAPASDCLAFSRSNISIAPQRETGGNTFGAKVLQVMAIPAMVAELSLAMYRADAIHVRCPGYLGLLGAVLAPIFSKHVIAKYAGQWSGYAGEPKSVRLQRFILGSRWWRGLVTVYGRWPAQPTHVIPFFTSIMSDEQMSLAWNVAQARPKARASRLLYVGRLSASKNVDKILASMGILKEKGINLRCTIVGDGPERCALEQQTSRLRLEHDVKFAGGVAFDRIENFYKSADVLILASETEGWPKAIAEAMAYGLICVGSNLGLVPEILGEGRGIVVPPGDVEALSNALEDIIQHPAKYESMGVNAAGWARQYSLDGLREAIGQLLSEHWGVDLPAGPKTSWRPHGFAIHE
jgi:glycosyltransferase involved in cell wall biosynthesis